MTDDRSLERAARSWLETGPTEAPDHAVEAALLRIQTTTQERDWLQVPRRIRPMTMTVRLVAAAIALAVVAFGGAFILRPNGQPDVGGPGTPSPSTAPALTPSAAPSPSRSSQARFRAPAPDNTLGDWQAVADTSILGLFDANEHIQLSIDWQQGRSTWIQTSSHLVLKSDTLAPLASNEIDLVTSTDGDTLGCEPDQFGRYGWSRSADGLFLTLTAIEEACANRQAAMSRTWVHSQSAVTDGKTGVFPLEGAWVKMTLPSQRFGLSGDGLGYLHPMEGPDRTLVAINDPMGIDVPCGANPQAIQIPKTTAGIVAYIRTIPGFNATTATATVGGRPAVHVTMRPKGSAPCVDGEVAAFHGNVAVATDGEWKLAVGKSHSVWIVDMGGDADLFIYEGADVTPADETSVISSFEFLTDLPTP